MLSAKKLVTRILTLSLITLSFPMYAQQHPCSEHKQQAQKRIEHLRGKQDASKNQMEMMEKYDVKFHHLNLNIERTSTAISGNVQTIAVARESIDTFVFQLYRSLAIDSVVGNSPFSFMRDSDMVYVVLDRIYNANEKINLTIYYRGTPPAAQSSAIGAGFSNRASPTYGNRITWSLSQPYSAYEWWPCKQSLQDKIDSIKFYITTDTSNKAGSNGVLKQIVPLGGKHRFEWESKFPISYYLIAVAVGQYTEYQYWAKPKLLTNDSVFIQNYIYSNPLAFTNNRNSIEATGPQLELFSELYGLYPFHNEKYGHMMAPFSGGMEHQTMTSQGIFNFDIIAHELAHQWFGDHVTCATWSDIWLNEGFASYSEYLANEFLNPTSRIAKLNEIQSSARNTSFSVWVNDTTSVSRIFNSNSTYQKGAAILHVLRHVFNYDSLFFAMLTDFQQRFAMGNANVTEFKEVAEQYYIKSLNDYFNEWYYGKGYPNYSLRWNQVGGQVIAVLSQVNGRGETTRFTTRVPLRLNGTDTKWVDAYPSGGIDTFYYNAPFVINSISIDPDNWLLKAVNTNQKDETITSIGKAQQANNSVLLYPNPAQDMLTIITENNVQQVDVFDITGKHIEGYNLEQDKKQISITTIPNGIYFLQIQTNKGMAVPRLVIYR
jgi:aminopeptidase N